MMDPNANLRQQESILNRLTVVQGARKRMLEIDLSELRQALYDWIREGGFDPDWSAAPKAAPYFIGNKERDMKERNRRNRKVAVENISDSNAENACVPGETQVTILSDPPFVGGKTDEVRREGAMPTITLKYKGTQKNGIHTFSDESRGASIYVNKSMFADGARPDELTLEAPEGVFADPGSGRAPKGASPEKAAKAEEAAKKAQERAEKAQERAKKAQEKLGRLQKALGTEPAAEQPSA